MPSWIAKAAVQGVLSLVPGGRASNRLLQDFRRTAGTDFFEEKLELCRHHLSHRFELGGAAPGTPFSALELGSGRVPLVPLGLALCGAVRVTSLDLVDMVHPELTRRALRYLLDEADAGRLARRLPWIQPERVEALRRSLARADSKPLRECLAGMGIELRIQDVCRLPVPEPAYDLIVSNNTLEHIARDALDGIFSAFRRLAAPGATMSHFIDLVDHYAHFDRKLTPYNFLRFRPGVWRLLNNPLQYQNRLRVSDYRGAHARAGFRIVREENDASAAAQLDGLQVAPEFRHYSLQDLAVTTSWMASRPERSGAGPGS
jgi:methyltransferase family protein